MDTLSMEILRMILIETDSWYSVESMSEVSHRCYNMVVNMEIPFPVVITPTTVVRRIQRLTAINAEVTARFGRIQLPFAIDSLVSLNRLRFVEFMELPGVPFSQDFVSHVVRRLANVPTLEHIQVGNNFNLWSRFLNMYNTPIVLEDYEGNRLPPLPPVPHNN